MTPRAHGPILAGVMLVVVGVTIAAGLALVGSPAEARRQRLDDRRVSDLNEIARALDLHWTRTQGLPASLDLAGAATGHAVPRDPETGAPYPYRVVDAGTYELCAEFARASDDEAHTIDPLFWTHAAGRQCFTVAPKEIRR